MRLCIVCNTEISDPEPGVDYCSEECRERGGIKELTLTNQKTMFADDSPNGKATAAPCSSHCYAASEIVHGDAFDVLSELESDSIDMIFSDPPYKIAQDYGTTIDADRLCSVASIMKTVPQMARVLKPGRFAALFYDNRILPLLFDAVRGTGLIYQRQLFVYRANSVHAFCWHGWMNCTDPICLFVKGGAKRFQPTDKPKVKHDCYTRVTMNDVRSGHPAQKPEDVCQHIVEWCSDAGESILDPYCGGASIGRAAIAAGRRYVGIEINEQWVDMAKRHASPSA